MRSTSRSSCSSTSSMVGGRRRGRGGGVARGGRRRGAARGAGGGGDELVEVVLAAALRLVVVDVDDDVEVVGRLGRGRGGRTARRRGGRRRRRGGRGSMRICRTGGNGHDEREQNAPRPSPGSHLLIDSYSRMIACAVVRGAGRRQVDPAPRKALPTMRRPPPPSAEPGPQRPQAFIVRTVTTRPPADSQHLTEPGRGSLDGLRCYDVQPLGGPFAYGGFDRAGAVRVPIGEPRVTRLTVRSAVRSLRRPGKSALVILAASTMGAVAHGATFTVNTRSTAPTP